MTRLLTMPRSLDPLLWTILLACVIRFWIMPLPSSFWVDEMGTAFVVHFGGNHPSFAIAPQVPASLYYALPRLFETLFLEVAAAYAYHRVEIERVQRADPHRALEAHDGLIGVIEVLPEPTLSLPGEGRIGIDCQRFVD